MWKTVDEYKNYEVSDNGTIRNKTTGHKLKPWESTGGYMYIAFCDNGKQHSKRVHRIVAKAFCSNPFNKTQVNHIDGNKKNNSANNLEWCSSSENMTHAFQTGLQTHIGKYPIRKVICLTDGKVFATIRQASEFYGIAKGTIYACCTRQSKRSKNGLIFRFV